MGEVTGNTITGNAPTGSTPILDRFAPLPQPAAGNWRRRTFVGFAIVLVLGVLAILMFWEPLWGQSIRRWLLVQYPGLFKRDWAPAQLVFASMSLVIMSLIAIAVHEVGHVIGGIFAGFRFNSLRLGPLQIDRPFRVSFQRSLATGYAGWTSMFPVHDDKLRTRAIILILAGPGANLLSGIVLLALPFSKGLLSASFVLFSFLLALKELLPTPQGIAASDGRRIWLLLSDPGWGTRWLALMRLSAELKLGLLPESLSTDWLTKATAYRDNSSDTVLAYALAFSAAFHLRKDTEAAQLLETSLRYSGWAPPAMREAVMSEAAVFQARRRKRPDLAEQWLALMPQLTAPNWLRLRAEAGILEARGDLKGALSKLDEIEEASRVFPDLAQRQRLLRLMVRWRSELRRCEVERPSIVQFPSSRR